MKPDAAIEEVREVRRRISARFGNDPEELVRYDMRLQRELSGHVIVVSEAPHPGGEDPGAADRVAERPRDDA